jgi:superfamily II DNA/RNA helicase
VSLRAWRITSADTGLGGQVEAGLAHAGLFSATQTEAVQALARAGLRNPVRINVAVAGAPAEAAGADAGVGQKTPSRLTIQYMVCGLEQKLPHLVHFLQVAPAADHTSSPALTPCPAPSAEAS